MNPLRSYQINRIASLAMVLILSACGGGGTSERPSTIAADVAALLTDVPVPQLASAPAQIPWDDPVVSGHTVLPDTAPSATGGEPPYPDLGMLPTQATSFEPVVFGDVPGVSAAPKS